MYVSHRRTTVRCLAALALGLATLTGCGGQGDGQADTAASGTSATTATPAAEASPVTARSGGATPEGATSAPTGATSGATPSSAGAAPEVTPSAGVAPWAGTKQFVQIDDARTSGGVTYLSVRPAQKKAHPQFEAWVIVPGEGPYTEVPMAKDAKVLLSVPLGDAKHPASYSQADFVTRLATRSPSAPALFGFDLSFDGEGRVTRLQSLYTP
ncbi:hypothetical protein ABZ802_04665 [Streptomyces sp. NPDC047737]|jgi:hypothetical protein|uniref:hypothetical protein n=1 Tax=unclassified Streptomyces TaxID=2593676 RepID=UPI0033F9F2C8